MDINKMAEDIYMQVYGDVDVGSKIHHSETVQEIADWLSNRDMHDNPGLDELVFEWLTYNPYDTGSRRDRFVSDGGEFVVVLVVVNDG